MSLNLGVMSAAVTLDDKDYRNKLGGLENSSEASFKKIATLAAGYLSLRALGTFASTAIKTYSDLEEETNKFNVVFQNMGTETSRVLDELRKNFGLSELAAKRMLAGTGDILTGLGFDRSVVLDLSEGAAKLGADLASFSNYAGGAAGASNALTKAMLGETEQAKSLGIVIRQDDEAYKSLVKQAMTTGVTIDALGKTFTVQSEQQAKAVAALATAYKQSPNAIGDFVRSQDSIANQTRILQNNFEQLYATIGGDMSGSYQKALLFSNSLLKSYNELSPASRILINDTATLAAGFALIAKTGALSGANNLLGSVGKFPTIQKQTEANLVASTEQLKRTEYAKTDAFREAHAQAQSLRIARLAVQEHEAALATAKTQIASAQASGDATQILTAKKQLAAATQNLTRAQIAESTATQQLAAKHAIARTTTIQHAVAAKACAAASVASAQASTVAGRAQMLMAASMNTAKTAAIGLYSALGPVGIAMIALSSAYLAYNYLSEKNRKELEGQIELAHRNSKAANAMAVAHAKERGEDNARMERLRELSKYQRLNNSEKTEAEKLISILTKKYGDLGVGIDGVTGKLNIAAKAWETVNEAQARELSSDLNAKLKSGVAEIAAMQNALRNQLSSFWKNSILASGIAGVGNLFGSDDNSDGDFSNRAKNSERQQELDRILKLRAIEEQIAGFEKMRNSLTENGEREQAAAIETVVKKLREQQAIQKELDDLYQARKKNLETGEPIPAGGSPTEQGQKARELSEKERRAMESLENREWNIKFDASKVDEQIGMLDARLDKLLRKQSGKYDSIDSFKTADRNPMTEQELKDLQDIIELEGQREQIRKRSSEAFESEKSGHVQYLLDRDKKKQDREIERDIKKAQDSGDKTGADAIMQRELEKARNAARNMRQQYEQAVRDAEADGVLTEEEKKRVQELKHQMQQAMSDEDKWSERVANEADKDKRNQQTAVAWSSEILSAQLGGAMKPQEEVAKHTKRSMELLRDIKDNLKSANTEVLA